MTYLAKCSCPILFFHLYLYLIFLRITLKNLTKDFFIITKKLHTPPMGLNPMILPSTMHLQVENMLTRNLLPYTYIQAWVSKKHKFQKQSKVFILTHFSRLWYHEQTSCKIIIFLLADVKVG